MMRHELIYQRSSDQRTSLYPQKKRTPGAGNYQHHLEQVLEVAVVVLDDSTRIVRWNQMAEKLFGWEAHEVLGQRLEKVLPADYYRGGQEWSIRQLCSEGAWEEEIIQETKQGQEIAVRTTFTLIPDGDEIMMASRAVADTNSMKNSAATDTHPPLGIDDLPLAYIHWDQQFRIQQWSDQATAMFGWTEAEVRGKNLLQLNFIYPEDWSKVEKLRDEILNEDQKNSVCRSRYITKSGEVIYGECYNSVVRDHRGDITSVISLIQNVTDKVENKQKLDKAHQQLEHILSSVKHVVWCLELSPGRADIKYISPNVEKMTGLTSSRVAQNIQQWLHIIHPQDRYVYQKRILELAGRGVGSVELEYRIIDQHGRIKWVTDQISAEQKGHTVILSGSLKDTTDKRELRKLIEESERKIRYITETIPGFIFQFSRAQDGREWFEYLNKQGNQMLEMSEGRLQSNTSSFWEKIIPEDRPRVQEELRQSEVQLKRCDCSFRVKHNNKIFWYRAVSEPVWLEEEKRTLWTGIIMDTTEQLELLEQLEKRNFELNSFAHRVSHDLRAPLSSVKGIVSLTRLEEPSPAIASYLAMIESSVDRLDQFISNVLHHTKATNDQVEAEEIDFQKITDEVLGDLSCMPAFNAIEKQIQFTKSATPFLSDPLLVSVILRNLISNGIKYHDPEKSNSYFWITVAPVPEGIYLRYEDNGIGIASEKLAKVFDMFYRASKSSEGSGIGLYILKQAIEKLQGQIEVQSTLKQGTSFEITLPSLEKLAVTS